MDWWLILSRVIHVGAAMMWFGGAVISAFFLQPTARALGQDGQRFMDHVLKRRRMGIYFPIVATLTILAGAALYWRDSNGLDSAWISTPTGLAYTIGGIAAMIAFVGGFVLIGPSLAAMASVQGELAASGAPPTAAQLDRMARAEGRLRLAGRIDLPLILVAGLTMAVARYL
jgi:uncharacterized membrane protein